jgi:hypothetical protein
MINSFASAFASPYPAVTEKEAKIKEPCWSNEVRLTREKQYADGEEVMDYLLLLLIGFAKVLSCGGLVNNRRPSRHEAANP